MTRRVIFGKGVNAEGIFRANTDSTCIRIVEARGIMTFAIYSPMLARNANRIALIMEHLLAKWLEGNVLIVSAYAAGSAEYPISRRSPKLRPKKLYDTSVCSYV
jgi:hypothetical protein